MLEISFIFGLFASVFTVGKVALETIPPFYLTAFRYLVAGVILSVWEFSNGNYRKTWSKEQWLLLLGIGLFGIFLTNGVEFWGLQFLESGKACLLYSLSPFFSVILAYLFLGERFSFKKLIGLISGVLGCSILILSADSVDDSAALYEGVAFSMAELAVIQSALATVFGWIFFKKLTAKKVFPINYANGISFIVGGLISLAIASITEELPPLKVWIDPPVFFQVLYITVTHSIICYTLYARALQRFSVTFMMFAGLLNPVFTATYGYIFLDEKITLAFVICLCLVTLGLTFFYLEEKKTETFR